MLITGNVRVSDRAGAGALKGAVRLELVDLADAPSRVVASTAISLPAGVDHARFRLPVTEADVNGRYLVTARLEGDDMRTGQKRVFGTTAAFPWQPGASGEVSVEVHAWS